jgi:polysaccharide pyruvyl transferase WcaK-like protein
MIMKKYLLWGAVSMNKLLNPQYGIDYINRFANSGNLVIGHAVQSHLGYCHDELGFMEDFVPEEINEKYDALVIPASNFINEKKNLIQQSLLLERINIPVAVIGLGAQARNINSGLKLNKDLVKFLQILSSKSNTIGVRGFFTAELLFSAGIKNVSVIGCPGCFINMDPGFSLHKKPFQECFRSVIGMNKKNDNHHLFDFALNAKSTLIAQTEKDEVEMHIHDKEYFLKSRIFDEYYSKSKANPDQVFKYLTENTKIFYNIEKWQEELKMYDFSFGMRFHGNMMALQQKIPALWITHDSRTSELTSFLQLPNLDINELKNYSKIQDLYEITDYSRFNQAYQYLYSNYVNFLEKNGLEHIMPECTVNDLTEKIVFNYFNYQTKINKNQVVNKTPDEENSETIPFSKAKLIFSLNENFGSIFNKMIDINELSFDKQKGLSFVSFIGQPRLFLNLNLSEGFRYLIVVNLEVEEATISQLFVRHLDEKFSSEKSIKKQSAMGTNIHLFYLNKTDAKYKIRLDPGQKQGKYCIGDLNIFQYV